ncbi:hypothetical protein [Mycobacterium lepromatosis]|uniref:hypothetical protein n=1 Tax=Mycobacterium lepromatosis TaxID=480418 RepID=UPI000B2FA341
MEWFALDEPSISKIHPPLVYWSIPAFGTVEILHLAVYDLLVSALDELTSYHRDRFGHPDQCLGSLDRNPSGVVCDSQHPVDTACYATDPEAANMSKST